MNKKEQIIKLHEAGKSYNEIAKELKCSKGLIGYYLNPNIKSLKHERQNKNRFQLKQDLRDSLGNKCKICNYDKYYGALDFHHVEKPKLFNISDAIHSGKYSKEEIVSECKKCILLCANCHRELHGGIISV